MLAYQWEVFPFSNYRGDGLAKHSGITDSEETAITHVERILHTDSECAMGVMYPASMVYSATRALSYDWAPVRNGKRRFCTRAERGQVRWMDDPVKAVAI
jgi:hypothetical protein